MGRAVGALAQTAAISLIARSLGTADFATYGVVFSVCQVVVVMLEFGFVTRVLRLGAEGDPRSVMGALLVARALLVLVLVLVGTAFVAGTPTRSAVIWSVVIYVLGDALGDVAVGVLQGERKSFRAVGVLLVRRLIVLVPFLFGLVTVSAVSGLVIGGVAGLAVFLVLAVPRAGRPASLRSLLRDNGPLGLTSAATGLTQGDTALVSTVASATLIASYATAARLANPINLAVQTLLQVVIPELSNLDRPRRFGVFTKARRLVIAVAVVIAASSSISPLIVDVLFGDKFVDAPPILSGVLVGAAVSAVSQIHLAWLVVGGLRARIPVLLLAAIVVGLSTIVIGVELIGPVGAAVGIVITQVLILAVVVTEWFAVTADLRSKEARPLTQ